MKLGENEHALFRLADQRLVAIDGENQKVLGALPRYLEEV